MWRKRAIHHPPVLAPGEESRALENCEVLHETGQRHRGILRELADRGGAVRQPFENHAARGVRQRREHPVEGRCAGQGRLIVNHVV
jgi:hypothetical protein